MQPVYADGTGTAARFTEPSGVALDGSGNVYVADKGNNCIRKVTSAGVVTTFVGTNSQGFADGTNSSARFSSPIGIAMDSNGNLYVSDYSNYLIRAVTPGGVVTTFVGQLTPGLADGTGASAKFWYPNGVAVDSNGNLYVADSSNNCIRKVIPAGVVTTLAGSATSGFADGTGASASFDTPTGVAVDSTGTVYVGDQLNNCIRKITPAGVVTTLAGNGTSGSADGAGSTATFNLPLHIALDAAGNVYVVDAGNQLIRMVTPAGVVTTIAGGHASGSNDGTGTNAGFNNPYGVAVNAAGSLIVVSEQFGKRIRVITVA